jgi:hypothetical protein
MNQLHNVTKKKLLLFYYFEKFRKIGQRWTMDGHFSQAYEIRAEPSKFNELSCTNCRLLKLYKV